MRKMQFSVGATLALVLAAGTAIAHHKLPDGIHEAKAANGAKVLADAKGMTLYTFDKDTPGKSVCKDKCAVNWPPVLASAGAEAEDDWTIVTRDDGSKQWAYKGKPLYGWIKDTKPGETTGDGVGKVWHIAVP